MIAWLVDDIRPGKNAENIFNLADIMAMIKDSSIFAALLGITLYGTGYGIFLRINGADLSLACYAGLYLALSAAMAILFSRRQEK